MLFGCPLMLQPDQMYCILHHEGFVSAYSHNIFMPLWSSFTIEKPVRVLLEVIITKKLWDSGFFLTVALNKLKYPLF